MSVDGLEDRIGTKPATARVHALASNVHTRGMQMLGSRGAMVEVSIGREVVADGEDMVVFGCFWF